MQRLDYNDFANLNFVMYTPHHKFGFAGGIYDPDTELVRFGARDYDPRVGRWTAKDPIRFAGGDVNLYGYVLGDPVNLVGPDGENPLLIAAAIGATIGAISGAVTASQQPGADAVSIGTSAVVGAGSGGASVLGGPLGGAFFAGVGNLGIQLASGQAQCGGLDFEAAADSAIAGGIGSVLGGAIAGARVAGGSEILGLPRPLLIFSERRLG